jgi:hypothetical protein
LACEQAPWDASADLSGARADHPVFAPVTANPADYQFMNGRPIPAAEKEFHEREIRRLKSDKAWVARYLGGELEARETMAAIPSAA